MGNGVGGTGGLPGFIGLLPSLVLEFVHICFFPTGELAGVTTLQIDHTTQTDPDQEVLRSLPSQQSGISSCGSLCLVEQKIKILAAKWTWISTTKPQAKIRNMVPNNHVFGASSNG